MSPEHLTFVLISRVKEPSVMSVRPTTPFPSGVSALLVYPASQTPWVYLLGASKIPVSEGAPERLCEPAAAWRSDKLLTGGDEAELQ